MTVYDDALRSIQEGMSEPVEEVKGSLRQRKKQGRLEQGAQDRAEQEQSDHVDQVMADQDAEEQAEVDQAEQEAHEVDDKVDAGQEPQEAEQEVPSPTPEDWADSVANDYDSQEEEEPPAQEMHADNGGPIPSEDEPKAETGPADDGPAADFDSQHISDTSLFKAVQAVDGAAFAKAVRDGANDADLDDLAVAIQDEGLTAVQNLVTLVAKAVKRGGRATT